MFFYQSKSQVFFQVNLWKSDKCELGHPKIFFLYPISRISKVELKRSWHQQPNLIKKKKKKKGEKLSPYGVCLWPSEFSPCPLALFWILIFSKIFLAPFLMNFSLGRISLNLFSQLKKINLDGFAFENCFGFSKRFKKPNWNFFNFFMYACLSCVASVLVLLKIFFWFRQTKCFRLSIYLKIFIFLFSEGSVILFFLKFFLWFR